MNLRDERSVMAIAARRDGPPTDAGSRATASSPASARLGSPDEIARRALDVGRRTAIGVLAGDTTTADDVAQEVAIQALRQVHRLRDPQALDAWLYRTAVRAALKAVRRGRRQRAVEQDHAIRTAPTVVGEDVPTAALEELGRLLRGLPERQRAALTLRYAHDLDDAQIAAALGCRSGTVRALLSRGRAAVRERLERESYDGDVAVSTTNDAQTEGADHVAD